MLILISHMLAKHTEFEMLRHCEISVVIDEVLQEASSSEEIKNDHNSPKVRRVRQRKQD